MSFHRSLRFSPVLTKSIILQRTLKLLPVNVPTRLLPKLRFTSLLKVPLPDRQPRTKGRLRKIILAHDMERPGNPVASSPLAGFQSTGLHQSQLALARNAKVAVRQSLMTAVTVAHRGLAARKEIRRSRKHQLPEITTIQNLRLRFPRPPK